MRAAWRISSLSVLSLFVAVNFYVFARFTVDDAFITWRYGKNLVATGIWGFNPTVFDLTQAYTNPIYAVLSIVPAFIGMDMVLFFKLISLMTLLLPVVLLCRPGVDRTRFATLYLLFLAMPATMLHVFSGLETFLFVVLLAGLFVALIEARFGAVNVLALMLLLVRPEAWVLVGLVPVYVLLTPAFAPCVRRAVLSFLLLGGAFAFYALFHYQHFGHVLPNTFYVKTGVPFNLNVAVYFLAYVAPACVLLLTPHWRVLVFVVLFYVPMAVSYSSATLMMNFAARFAFHFWAGVVLLVAYVVAAPLVKRTLFGLGANGWAVGMLAVSTLLMGTYSIHPEPLMAAANGYPRMQDSHVALGKRLHDVAQRYAIDTYALSDVGANPFHSGLIAYDSIGLGSSLVAHQGATLAVIAQYQPDMAVISLRDGKAYLPGEQVLEGWLETTALRPLCEVVQWPGRSLRLYTRERMPELQETCDESRRRNDVGTAVYFRENMRVPPWRYWRE